MRSSTPRTDLRAVLEWARRELSGSGSGALEAEVLLSYVLAIPRSQVLAHPEHPLSETAVVQYRGLISRCAAGEPLAYLTGEREFFSLPFCVTPDVLIPRPETELLVEHALRVLRGMRDARAADIGTGCGCIAVSLAADVADLAVDAVDLSAAALAVAARNAARHRVAGRIRFLRGDLLAPLKGVYGLICANLPYIPSETLNGLEVVRHEPRAALDGGEDGLRLIERALEQCPRRLARGGTVLFELEERQGTAVTRMARDVFSGARVIVLKDYAGRDRLLEIQS